MALLLMLLGSVNASALESYDFQELCMALGKGGPWAVNDGGDAGFTIGEATMHYLGDYVEQGFTWNQRFAYEYVEGRDKFTMRNKNNKKDSNCGMFSWDYDHYFSILDLKDGDKVTITVGTGNVTFVSATAEGVAEGDAVTSNQTYTITTTEETTRLDIQMAKASLIAKIVIEPAGEETVPAISVSPKTLNLVPGATAKVKATVDPAGFTTSWKSSDEQVATVAADGTVTAVAAGTATITNYWNSEVSEATASDACEVTVTDVDLSKLTVANEYDFEAMGDVTLELSEDAAGEIWNEANSKVNKVYFCTNEGLELLAVQAAVTNNKGWSIVEDQGLFLASGAGRCAAIGGITKGQIVEFIYTGDAFYTRSDDDGIEKVALNEETGRAIYQAGEDGMIGFELVKGNAVKKITIYEAPAESAEVVFDFNASDHAVSSNDSTDGDITEAYTETIGDVTMTVTPADPDAKTANRFWGTKNGPQLRMYSGKIILEAAEKAIVKVVVNQGKWSANNAFNGEVSATSEWEGNSTNVVLDIAANTQMNSITVALADRNDETTTYIYEEISDAVINVDRYPGMGYSVTEAEVDFTEALSFLGVEELTTDMLRIENPDGTLISDYAPYDGWFNGDGVAETWGSNTKVCVKFFQAIPDGKFEICDMNDADEVGKTYTVRWRLVNGTKNMRYTINVTFVEPEAVELTVVDKDIVTSIEYDNSEGSYTEKVASISDEQVAAICEELGVSTLADATVFGYNPTTKELVVNYDGYDGWRDANGDFHNWTGDTTAPVCVKYTDGQNYYCYNISGCEPQTIKCYWALANEEKAVLVEIDFIYSAVVDRISSIEQQHADSNVVYNLQGQQVKQAQKGLYIVNGKKVVVK